MWEGKRKLSEVEIGFKLFYAKVALKCSVLKEYRLDIWLKFIIQYCNYTEIIAQLHH